MEETVLIHGDKWKLADIREEVDWCLEQSWVFAVYDKPSDHAHCSICWWSILQSDDPQVGQGYLSGRNIWLCQECYGKFIAKA